MVGIIESSYYRVPSDGEKGNKPSKETFHNIKGFVSQDAVVVAVKDILMHEFIDCGYRLMTSYFTLEPLQDHPDSSWSGKELQVRTASLVKRLSSCGIIMPLQD